MEVYDIFLTLGNSLKSNKQKRLTNNYMVNLLNVFGKFHNFF